MRFALRLAQRGLGTTAANPSVGAAIVRDGVVLGIGWTQPGGRPHGEVHALASAGTQAVRAATLYVTLEPCCHVGRSGPCTDAIIAAGIARVVIGCRDANPAVNGRGIAVLRDAGIAVDLARGELAGECRWMVAGHTLRLAARRPFVQAKLAASADLRIAAGDGAPVWVTGPIARSHGHLLRARAEMIAIGAGTFLADDPSLTCRIPGLADRSPKRLLIKSSAELPAGSAMARAAGDVPTFVTVAAEAAVKTLPDDVRKMAAVRDAAGCIDLARLLATLATEHEITRLLVEGGPELIAGFIRRGLIDECVLFQGPAALGAKGIALPPDVAALLDGADAWPIATQRMLGPDWMRVYRSPETAARLASETPASGAPTGASQS